VADSPDADVVIAGGGPVGCTLALALSESSLDVVHLPGDRDAPDRPIALSHGSRLILEHLGVWQRVTNTPIATIHVSQRNGFGRVLMRASEHGLPALGYVTSYGEVLAALAGRTRSTPGALAWWEAKEERVGLRVDRGSKETAFSVRLLVLADGGMERRPVRVKDYLQAAIVADVLPDRAHRGMAWERFTGEGPLALLPFRDRYAMVWSVRPATARELLDLSDSDFLARLRQTFGARAGDFVSVGPRAAFPLSLRQGAPSPAPRTLAIGNAAQTLHPVAGQGLNLGLRDAWELARMLLDTERHQIGAKQFVDRYLRARRSDRFSGIGVTDFLVRIFSNSLPPLALARGAGLTLLDMLPPARRFLARRMIFGTRALP